METSAAAVVPALTRSGRSPKPSSTDSPSSSTASSSAATVNALEVSPLAKVTLAGATDQSPAAAPFWPVAVIGITTVRSGTALSVIVTVTSPPSSTLWAALAKLTVTRGWSSSSTVTSTVAETAS